MANGNVPVDPQIQRAINQQRARFASSSTDPAELARQAREAQAYIQGKGPPVEEGGGITLGYGGGAVGYTRSIRTPIVFQPTVSLPNVSRSQINRIEQIRNSFSAPNVFFTGFKGSNVGPDVLLGVQQNIRVQRFNQFVEQALDSQSAKASEIEQKTSELNREAQKLQEDSDRFSRNVNNYDERTYQFAVSDLTTRIDSFNQKAAELENEANRFNSQSRALEMQLKAQAEQLERQNIRTSSLREREPLNIITRSEKPFSGSKDTSLAEPVAPLSDKRVITAGPLSEFNIEQAERERQLKGQTRISYALEPLNISGKAILSGQPVETGLGFASVFGAGFETISRAAKGVPKPQRARSIEEIEAIRVGERAFDFAAGLGLGQRAPVEGLTFKLSRITTKGRVTGTKAIATDSLFASGPLEFTGTRVLQGVERNPFGFGTTKRTIQIPFSETLKTVSRPALSSLPEYAFSVKPLEGIRGGGFLAKTPKGPIEGFVTNLEAGQHLVKLATPVEFFSGPNAPRSGLIVPTKGSLTIRDFYTTEKIPRLETVGIRTSRTGLLETGERVSSRATTFVEQLKPEFQTVFSGRSKTSGKIQNIVNVRGTIFGTILEEPKPRLGGKGLSGARGPRVPMATEIQQIIQTSAKPFTETPTIQKSVQKSSVVSPKVLSVQLPDFSISDSAVSLGKSSGTRALSRTRPKLLDVEVGVFPTQSFGSSSGFVLQFPSVSFSPSVSKSGRLQTEPIILFPRTSANLIRSSDRSFLLSPVAGSLAGFDTAPLLGTRSGQSFDFARANAQSARSITRPRQVQVPRTTIIPRPFFDPPRPTTPRPPTGRILFRPRKSGEATEEFGTVSQGFDVFVRKKGKRVRVASGLPIGRALAFGARTVAGTIAASFSLGRGRPTRQSDIAFRLGQQFRPSKRGLGFVERRRYRLDQPFEVQQIQSARKQKRKK